MQAYPILNSQIGEAMPAPAALPDHLVPLPADPWAFWRWVGVRGAGFAINYVLSLAAPECAVHAERLLEREAARDAAREHVLDALRRAADHAAPSERLGYIRALQNFKKGKGSLPDEAAINAAAAEFAAAAAEHAAAQAAFAQVFATATLTVSRSLRALADDAALREAITWQNRQAVTTALDVLLRTPSEGSSSKTRQKEVLIASYVQRYSTKNDTIGFFGPVGWAQFQPDAAALAFVPGPQLVAERRVYFETWSIDALGDALAQDETIRPWIAPRRMPFVRVEGTTLFLPLASPVTIKPAQAAVLAACDGKRTARMIARSLLSDPALGFAREADVYAVLTQLQRMRRIAWTPEVPSDDPFPERHLRRQLERIEDPVPRQTAVAALDELEAAREAVARASGDAEALHVALQQLEATFTRLAGAAATRNAGKTYAGRTLVYEDCRRAAEVTLGSELLEVIAAPLALLLASTRWLTYEVAQFYRRTFHELYADLCQKTGSRTIDFTAFWLAAHPLIAADGQAQIEPLVARLQALWTDQILALKEQTGCVRYASAELRERVLATFAAPAAGWLAARYHSPDIMIAASSVEGIRQGEYQLVLGEFHVGLNTLNASLFVQQHPDPQQLWSATEHDLPAPVFVPLPPKPWPAPPVRVLPVLHSAKDLRLAVGVDACATPEANVISSADLVVEAVGGDLSVRTRDGSAVFDVIEVFAEYITGQVVSRFKPIQSRPHLPRVMIDRLVINRESWQIAAASVPFARIDSEAERFVAARRWMRQLGLPRWVFVKAPVEPKPFFLDLDSPIYLDIIARIVRRCVEQDSAATITITEMLPRPDQLWLHDQAGYRYTSELRLVAVDQTHR